MDETLHILLADDDAVTRVATARLLRQAGYEVEEAASGAEAVAKAASQAPDIVMLDVHLGDADGRDLCRSLRQDARLTDTFLVLVSASAVSTDDQATGLEMGADGYVTRPIGNREMLARVGAFARMQAVVRERRRFDEELFRQHRLDAVGSLARGVGHEINNPLSLILNFGQLIADAAPPGSEIARYATDLLNGAERIATIVRTLNGLSSPGPAIHTPVRPTELLEPILALLGNTLRDLDGIDVQVDVPADLPRVRCRKTELRYVLAGVIENAREALNRRYPEADPGKTMSITACRIDDPEPGVRFAIEDGGGGFSPEALAHLFEPFYTTKSRAESQGLSLAICRSIVASHRGRMRVESETGRFTRVLIDLPTGD